MTRIRLILAAITTVIATIVISLIGVEPIFALGYGILAGVCVLLTALRRAGAQLPEPPSHRAEPAMRGSEISRLAWGFNPRTQLAGEIVARRARAVLRRRLALIGVDPDAQPHRVDEILGAGVWERLSTRKASATDIDRALSATEPATQETP